MKCLLSGFGMKDENGCERKAITKYKIMGRFSNRNETGWLPPNLSS
jgi:hypothetical protein